MALPKFAATRSFHTELKTRINQYFEESGRPMTGNFSLLFKAVLLITIMAALYVHLVFFTPATSWALLECALLGCDISAVGFNVMHDGAHGSLGQPRGGLHAGCDGWQSLYVELQA